MNNKYIILLVSVFGINSANGMRDLKGLAKQAFMASLVAGSGYAVNNQVKCDSIERASGAVPGDFDKKKYPNLAKFVVMHRCSSELEAYQEQHFMKGDQIDRIINAERMKIVIRSEGLDRLEVAHKCLARMSDGYYEVLSQKIERQIPQTSELSLLEVEQFFKLVQTAGYTDWHDKNLIRSISGKIVFCDTEDRSFMFFDSNATKSNLSEYFYWAFLTGDMGPGFRFNEDVKKWITDKNKELEFSVTGKETVVSLKLNSDYDKEIDFEKVKKEFEELRRS